MRVAWRIVVMVVCLAMPSLAPGALGQDTVSQAMVETVATSDGLEWNPRIEYERMVLTISGQDVMVRREFGARERPKLEPVDEKGRPLPDGSYTWELRAVPKMDPELRKRLTEIRNAGDEEALREMRRKGLVPREAQTRSGYILVENGKLASRKEEEPSQQPRGRSGRTVQRIEGGLKVEGDLSVSGTKSFVVPDPEEPGRRIYFAALEGPEAGTYFRGSAATEAGRAVIELPTVFAKVTEAEGVTVQLTPTSGWARLWVEEKGPDRLVIRQAEGDPPVEFDFLVQGVRKGYAAFEVERPDEDETRQDGTLEGGEGR